MRVLKLIFAMFLSYANKKNKRQLRDIRYKKLLALRRAETKAFRLKLERFEKGQ